MRRLALLPFAALAFACAPPSPTTVPPPTAIFGPGTHWAEGMQAFEEHTADVGITGVAGVRIHAIDYDGDGWTDLFILNGRAVVGDGKLWSTLLRNDQHGGFTNVTADSHILARRSGDAQERPVDVAVFGDVDGDGDLDAYLGVSTESPMNNGNETSELMIQNADHTFSLGPAESDVRLHDSMGLLTDTPSGASFTDYDLDGDLDLFVSEFGITDAATGGFTFVQSRLFQNDGAGHFTDVSDATHVTTEDWIDIDHIDQGLAHPRAWSANSCDLNDDGLPDLLAASYGRAPNHIWQNGRGDGAFSFTNRSAASGYAYDMEMDWTDNQFALCYCTSAPTTAGCPAGAHSSLSCPSPAQWDPSTDTHAFRLGGNSGASMCGDIDNDGDLDLLTSEIQHWWAGGNSDRAEVLVNDGNHDFTFSRPGRDAMGIVIPHTDPNGWDEGIMTGAIFDFDNDGWPDLYFGMSDYPGNHGILVHQTATAMHFESVPIAQGIDHHRSHGIGIADFDRDGDLDVVVGHSLARCSPTSYPDSVDPCYATGQIRYWRNTMGGNFVQLHLVGDTANGHAIGARISVTTTGVATPITQRHDIEGGHGHYTAEDDFVQHFGLGTAHEADVTIRWPEASLPTQTFHVVAGHRFLVRQGETPVLDDVVPLGAP